MEQAGREPLTGRDWIFLAVCGVVFAASLYAILRWFGAAFPEASIDFKYDRGASRVIAERLLASEHIDVRGMKHSALFDADDNAKIFLERTLGLRRANQVMAHDVHVWYWHHRWFRPLQEEEYAMDVAPTGEIVTFGHHMPESKAMPTVDANSARAAAEAFLGRAGVRLGDLQLVAQSERHLPHRLQRIFTWDAKSVRPGGAPYRYTVVVDGGSVSDYSQRLKVPDAWQRSYRELRSKNNAAGNVDTVFMIITMIAAVAVFIIRLRRGDLHLRFLLSIGAVAVVLTAGNALNSYPSVVAGYDTTMSWPAFLAQYVLLFVILQSVATAMLLIVVCGAGEVLYRERLPQHLAIPRVFTPRALASKRVFRSFVLGYTLVAFFIAYQAVYYLVAGRFGAWSPAELPYDNMLKSAFPWIAVLFAGFFPALNEEFLCRAFSIPLFERFLKSRLGAIVAAGFIWGFGHATYPNQPFYIRGVEVGLAGVLLGFLLFRFGLLPLLIWHYTVDALYTALLLLRSHNTYYVVSAGAASLLFAIPMVLSIALYLRNRGFIPDGDLSNATLPVSPTPPTPPEAATPPLPPPVRVTPARAIACLVAVAVAAILVAYRTPSTEDAIDYRITKEEAKAIATAHLTRVMHQPVAEKTIARPSDGFRHWEPNATREEGGGAPDVFDRIAANYLVRHGVTPAQLTNILRTRIRAGTWSVRFFTPMQKEEWFIEVDPRTSRAIGYHKYQDERNAGPRLEQAAAESIARAAFATYGEDVARFDLAEALSFQQPNRRDWLFHFQEQQPIAAEAYRRITVRVAGAEVTHFTTTIKVPDAAYREASMTTILDTVMLVIKLAGGIGALTLVVAGFVLLARRGFFPWRSALRWTLVLAIIPIGAALTDIEPNMFNYNTSVAWETFVLNETVSTVRTLGLWVLFIFLAMAGIETVCPYARELVKRAGRARFGRAAAIAAITAVAIFAAVRELLRIVTTLVPAWRTVSGLGDLDVAAVPVPSLLAIGNAILWAVIGTGVIALFSTSIRAMHERPWMRPLVTIAVVFCASVEGAMPHELPMMLIGALTTAILAWCVARYVLGANGLAWPLAIFLALALQSATAMLHHHRYDLQMNGVVVIVACLAALAWAAAARRDTEPADA